VFLHPERLRIDGSLATLATTLVFVARTLAEAQPEMAAVLLGGCPRAQGLRGSGGGQEVAGARSPNRRDEFVAQVRRDTSQLLVETLGETRTRELRAQGEAMDRDQALAYAHTHIDEYLAALAPEAT